MWRCLPTFDSDTCLMIKSWEFNRPGCLLKYAEHSLNAIAIEETAWTCYYINLESSYDFCTSGSLQFHYRGTPCKTSPTGAPIDTVDIFDMGNQNIRQIHLANTAQKRAFCQTAKAKLSNLFDVRCELYAKLPRLASRCKIKGGQGTSRHVVQAATGFPQGMFSRTSPLRMLGVAWVACTYIERELIGTWLAAIVCLKSRSARNFGIHI